MTSLFVKSLNFQYSCKYSTNLEHIFFKPDNFKKNKKRERSLKNQQFLFIYTSFNSIDRKALKKKPPLIFILGS